MLLSYEEACFYYLLLKTGYTKEVDEWIDGIAYNNETLEDINLELVYKQSNTNELISCLYNYINEQKMDDKLICEKLRLFIKQKLDNNEITIEEAANSLCSFSLGNGDINAPYWIDFYMVSVYGEYVDSSLLEKAKYHAIVRQFVNTGNKLDSNDFWNERDKKYKAYKASKKKETKYKIICALALILYSLFIIFVICLLMGLEKNNKGTISEKSFSIYLTFMVLLIVPPVVITVVGWDMVYDKLTSAKRNKNLKIKEEKERIKQEKIQRNKEIRNKYNIPNNILTSEEYFSSKFGFNLKWILLIICEVLCLGMTIGSVFYYDLVGNEIGIGIILLGLVIGIYGFCILCDAPVKGLIYSFAPVLSYAIPLIVIYYLLNIRIGWKIGLFTILFGTLIWIFIIIFIMVKPIKKYNMISGLYYNEIQEKYPKINHYTDYYSIDKCITLWKKDGTHIIIFEYEKNNSSLTLTGKIKYNNVILKDVILEYKEINDNFDMCVLKGIELLNNYGYNKSL